MRPLEGITTVHCEVAAQVETRYRALHLLDTRVPEGVRFYSGCSGEAFELNQTSAAVSIVAQAVAGIDYPRVVRRA